jgi:hypothetical protein
MTSGKKDVEGGVGEGGGWERMGSEEEVADLSHTHGCDW